MPEEPIDELRKWTPVLKAIRILLIVQIILVLGSFVI